ncbi:MAG: hypothetical protein OHK0057_07210 [Thermoflexibacter sp.]
METLKNDVFFQNFVEELGDKQVLLINKNKKNILVCYDLWEGMQTEKHLPQSMITKEVNALKGEFYAKVERENIL